MSNRRTVLASIIERVYACDLLHLRFLALVLAILVYALLSSPTPDAPGWVEGIVGVLLVFAIGASVHELFRDNIDKPLWQGAGLVFMVCGVSVPLLTGVLAGHAPGLIVRDVAPFLFLFLPVFLHSLFQQRPALSGPLTIAIVIAGVTFAGRALADIYGLLFTPELTYFANAPTVLLAALLLCGGGVVFFVRHFTLQAGLLAALAFILAAVPLLAMAAALQRASLGYFAIYALCLLIWGLWRYPQRMFLAAALAAFMLWPFYGVLDLLVGLLGEKTAVYGLNSRWREVMAVWEEISGSGVKVLLGSGWGGTLESPAVAGVRVNFTHGLLSSVLLKTGVFGLLLCVLYMASLGGRVFTLILQNPVMGMALAGPFLINVFLYASFKSLDFGLILLLIVATQLHESHRRCI